MFGKGSKDLRIVTLKKVYFAKTDNHGLYSSDFLMFVKEKNEEESQPDPGPADDAGQPPAGSGLPPKEIQLLSVVPERKSQSGACSLYRVTSSTQVTFLARRYRLAFVLDMSPTIATIVSTFKTAVLGTGIELSLWMCNQTL